MKNTSIDTVHYVHRILRYSKSKATVITMTTYAYTLVLNDSEMITLEAALKLLSEHCDQELKGGPKAPFLAWRENVAQIKARLYAHARQMSGGGIDPETGEYSIWIGTPGNPRE